MNEYDWDEDLYEHIQIVDNRLNYFHIDDISKCKLFESLTLAPHKNFKYLSWWGLR